MAYIVNPAYDRPVSKEIDGRLVLFHAGEVVPLDDRNPDQIGVLIQLGAIIEAPEVQTSKRPARTNEGEG